MIGFVPRLYQDELIYSFLARYHIYYLNKSPMHTSSDLFEEKFKVSVPDLPINLKTFYKNINIYFNLDINEIITKHTFFNFYTNFLDAKKKKFVKNSMVTGENKGAIHMATGIMASNVKEKRYFCYCPDCIVKDLDDYGETYWHLTHQLNGVLVCTKHGSLLQESTVLFRSIRRNTYEAASLENCNLKIKKGILSEKTLKHLLKIAVECEALNDLKLDLNKDSIEKIYKNLLIREGYSTYGNINQKMLANKFNVFYGDELLNIFNSNINYEDPSCWLKAITRKHRKTFHPVHHILLILFLNETVENLIKYKKISALPFGKGPHKCLNLASNHYGEERITDIEITYSNKEKKPVGTFKCDFCGFYYSRIGPDTNKDDLYRVDRVKQYGHTWVEYIRDMADQKKLSFRAIARSLKVDTNTVIKYYKERKINEKSKEEVNRLSLLLKTKRREWSFLLQENPTLSITHLRRSHNTLYIWLYRNDKNWLFENSSYKISNKIKISKVDWNFRDEIFSEKIKSESKILLSTVPPERVTVSKIGKRLGIKVFLEKHLEKLPLCKSILEQVKEEVSSFQIRRINYAIQLIKEQGLELKVWRVRKIAGLRNNLDYMVEEFIKQYY